jgi:UDP-2,3-diacylglucosamine pyrophosphatase LpxH
MRIDVAEERLIVISDLHLGNPYSLASRNLPSFVDYVIDGNYSLCINGDGVDILQGRFGRFTQHAIDVIDLLRQFENAGGRIYYVIGNHDIVLERALHTWMADYLTPFLNVRSGDLRVRIEHGHVHDAFYIASPRVYEILGMAVRPLLHVYPDLYRFWSATWRSRDRVGQMIAGTADEHDSAEKEAAVLLANRGFDVVVFGHTHRAECVELPHDAIYINSGNWLRDTTFVEIADNTASLQEWTRAGPRHLGP